MLGVFKVYDEILLSYSLLFTCDHESKKMVSELFAAHQMNVVFICQEPIDPLQRSVLIMDWGVHYSAQHMVIHHFICYGRNLAVIQARINERKAITKAYDDWTKANPQTFK